jgi:hypothetical protein
MATLYSPSVVMDGLILYLDAANSKSYSGSGADWNDLSKKDYNGTLINSPTYTAVPGYFTFNGSTQYATSPVSTQLGNTDYTIEFLLKVSSTSANYGILKWGSSPFNSLGKGIELRFQTNLLEYTIADGTGAGIRTTYSFTDIADDTYRHFTITQVAQGTVTIYVDGVSIKTGSYSGESSFTDTYTMWIARGNDGYLNGLISYLKIYDRVLSTDEIEQNFQGARGRFGI